jgi:hypothetical protein
MFESSSFMVRNVLLILLMILPLGSACSTQQDKPALDPYEECVARGNKILKSYPPKCVDEKGTHTAKRR